MEIHVALIKTLREKTGAGVMDCKKALAESKGDLERAAEALKQLGLAIAEKKKGRQTSQGTVEAYIHPGGRVGALVEVNCETDFVARTEAFRALAHDIAMQVAAMKPVYLSEEDAPQGEDVEASEVCLLQQIFIKDTGKTVGDLVTEVAAQVGENVRVGRFCCFELGLGA